MKTNLSAKTKLHDVNGTLSINVKALSLKSCLMSYLEYFTAIQEKLLLAGLNIVL